ncbi:hypothetical protein F0M18_07695 [Pseudohalioglobus sediminis]|uniref:Retropepsin-like aspartic endopeptidase domain-containing protein n=2 Tax=Pseudohalioglobus sediminis TaxID=2606449 RepID=A0A5B0X0T1_9GAMM|nr:hypothetical protein F0M18_07695 [Pseudohalioglobus sediminis]
MTFTRLFAIVLLLLGVSGCASVEPTPDSQSTQVTTAPACPEPPPCPVCEPAICPEPQVIEKIVEVPAPQPPQATTAGDMHLPIVGEVEWVMVEPAALLLEARIDTGAETTSIHAEDIQLVEKDGKRYVRFNLLNEEGVKIQQELRLRRRVLIKQLVGEPERRYVVRMWVTLAGTRSRIDVNLSDREDFEYPLLVGRNFLVDSVIVDVSRRYTQGR